MDAAGDVLAFDHDDHPDADFFVAADEWCTVDPAIAAFDVLVGIGIVTIAVASTTADGTTTATSFAAYGDPGDFCRDADTAAHCTEDTFANVWCSTNTVEET